MTALTEVFVTVKPDMDKFGPEVKKKLNRIDAKKEGSQVATRFGVGFNGAIGGIVSRSAGVFAAGFAAVKGVEFLAGFINDARESAKVARVSAQVIKSTGGVAKITAEQMGALATAISNKTGADDEAVQSGENLLATFTNVRNETGKGNDIFNQATQAAVDMASAMNNGVVDANGLKSANIQLGKALNDPVKGVTALSKVGVSFTQQQKDQIKTLVDSGKTLEAQKIILGEVGKEFGGAAAAASDPLTRLKTIAGNVSESLGGLLLPTVDKIANLISDTAIPGLYALGAAFKEGDVTSDGFVGVMERIGVTARGVFDYFKANVLPVLKDFGAFIVSTVLPAVGTFISTLAQHLAPVLRDAFGYFKSDILPVLLEFATFFYTKILPAVSKFVGYVITTLVPVIQNLVKNGMDGAKAAIDRVKTAFQENEPQIRKFIGVISEVVTWIATKLGPILGWLAGKQMKWVGDQIAGIITAIGKFVDAISWVVRTVQSAGTKIAEVWTGVKSASQSALSYVVQKFLSFVQTVLDGAAKAFGWVPKLGDKLKGAATEFAKFRDKTNAALGGITDQQINFSIKYTNTGVNLSTPSSVGRRAGGGPGGRVSGPGTGTSDSVGPYMLSDTEWVIKSASSQKYGDKTMASVNNGTATIIPGFAKGGSPGLSTRILSDTAGLTKSVRAVVTAAAASAAKQLAKSGGNLAGTMAFGRSQVGKPYVWGGVGPGGYDCSGFVSALINYARGRNPYRRIGATGSMPWSEFGAGSGRFSVGWFKGNPGHTAATINGVNFESRGGRGVVVGSGARGANNGLFTNRASVKGFAGGGRVGDAPYDTVHDKKKLMRELGIDVFDKGGQWRSGTLGANLSGKTETVVPGGGVIELGPKSINALADAIVARPTVLDGRRVDQQMSRRALGGGY